MRVGYWRYLCWPPYATICVCVLPFAYIQRTSRKRVQRRRNPVSSSSWRSTALAMRHIGSRQKSLLLTRVPAQCGQCESRGFSVALRLFPSMAMATHERGACSDGSETHASIPLSIEPRAWLEKYYAKF